MKTTNMNFIRLLVSGILGRILILIETLSLIYLFQLMPPNINFLIFHLPILALIAILSSTVYFAPNSKAGIFRGILFGIVFIALGAIIDYFIFIPMILKEDYIVIYRLDFILSYATIIIMSSIVGAIKK